MKDTFHNLVETMLFGFLCVMLLIGATPVTEATECIEGLPETIFDTMDNCSSQPGYDRIFGSQVIEWGGVSYLFGNTGNDLKVWDITDPQSPIDIVESRFRVGNAGDSDYDLLNFSVCDEGRYGIANYKMGTVLFDLGDGNQPDFVAFTITPSADNIPGSFTFMHDNQQYLIVSDMPNECTDGNATLYTFGGIDGTTDLTNIGCVDNDIRPTAIVGGFYIEGFLYLGDNSERLYIFEIEDTASTIVLNYISNPMNAFMAKDKSLAIDMAVMLAIEASRDGMHIWDISSPGDPVKISTVDGVFNRAALQYPIAFVANRGFRHSEKTFDISNLYSPQPIDQEFWSSENEWNFPDHGCTGIQGATFSPDGSTLYLARYSVMQLAAFGDCFGAPEADFTYAPIPAIVGEPVQFYDASSNGPTSWAWDFDDGTTSTERNPIHTFAATGAYSVSLAVDNSYGEASISNDVIVSEPPESTETRIFFPAVAAAAGAGQSFWSTDVEINNRTAGLLHFSIVLLKRGADNSEPQSVGPFILGVNKSARYRDVVSDLFNFEGAGALAFVFDDEVDAVLTSRTFNTFSVDDLEGTFGQAIPAVSENEMIMENTSVRLIQLSQNDAFRSNIGFLNGTESNIRIMVDFYLADGAYLGGDFQDLAPFSNLQWNSAFERITEDNVDDGWVEIWSETPGGLFTVYGSVVGNDDFNDPTTILPQ